MITVSKYIENMDQAPVDLMEFAESALEVKNDQELVGLASNFLEARKEFIAYLNSIGVRLG